MRGFPEEISDPGSNGVEPARPADLGEASSLQHLEGVRKQRLVANPQEDLGHIGGGQGGQVLAHPTSQDHGLWHKGDEREGDCATEDKDVGEGDEDGRVNLAPSSRPNLNALRRPRLRR